MSFNTCLANTNLDGRAPETVGKHRMTQNQQEYNHPVQMASVEQISKQLDDMKENLIKTSVRCHMLEVDLATQFSPHMVDTLRNVKQECERCKMQMKLEESTPDCTQEKI